MVDREGRLDGLIETGSGYAGVPAWIVERAMQRGCTFSQVMRVYHRTYVSFAVLPLTMQGDHVKVCPRTGLLTSMLMHLLDENYGAIECLTDGSYDCYDMVYETHASMFDDKFGIDSDDWIDYNLKWPICLSWPS